VRRAPLYLLGILCLIAAVPASADHVPIDVALKLRGPAFAATGSELTYSIDLTTLFPGAAYAVTDFLPPNSHLVRAGGSPWNCIQSRDKVTCGNERLQSGESSIPVTIIAPDTPQTITNNASVDSVSVFDPFPDNNKDSLTTVIYDAAVCGARSVQAVAPLSQSTVVGPRVTFRWSPVPSASGYQFWAGENEASMTFRGLTSETEIARDFNTGEVQWYVVAVMTDCPAVNSSPQVFRVQAPAARAHAAHH
jgi:hypothetical protein